MKTEALNLIKTPKHRDYTSKLEERAIEFHGHGGPFMILGLRMGLAALDLLDSWGWFGIRCRVYLKWTPPDSCVIDGIQSSTGCTMGKKNIEVEESDGISAEFQKEEKRIKITLRANALSLVKDSLETGGEAVENCMTWLREAEEEQLFHVEWIRS